MRKIAEGGEKISELELYREKGKLPRLDLQHSFLGLGAASMGSSSLFL